MPILPLQPVATISYSINAVGVGTQGFNMGLILGTSTTIPTATRVKIYTGLTAMTADGWSTSAPEYLAATQYFAQSPAPAKVAIGRQDLTVPETPLTALTACRLASQDWYIAYIPGAADADNIACSSYVESLNQPFTQLFVGSSNAAVLNNTAGNLFATLFGTAPTRTQGIYSAANTYLPAAVMGKLLGMVSNNAGSAFIEKFKSLAGATADSLTTAQVANIQGNNGNVYVQRAGAFTGIENGNNFSGQWFDNMLYGDIMVSKIQTAVANLLYNVPKVPQTEIGMSQLKAVIAQQCQAMVSIGWLGPGQWNGSNTLALSTGDYLPAGFLVQSDQINNQSTTDRSNRISPNIYVAAKTAGGIQDVFISINTNQ